MFKGRYSQADRTLEPLSMQILLNSGNLFRLNMNKDKVPDNLPFGETKTNFAARMDLNFKNQTVYSQIGLNHWYVVDGGE